MFVKKYFQLKIFIGKIAFVCVFGFILENDMGKKIPYVWFILKVTNFPIFSYIY